MTSDVINKENDREKKRPKAHSFVALLWKAIRGVVFLFFVIGLVTTSWIGSRFYVVFSDQRYEQTGDNWEYRNRVTDEELSDHKILTFKQSSVTDEELQGLIGRPDIAAVYLIHCPNISDACIETLAQIPNLRRLVIEHCSQLKNPDFSKLARLKTLTRLSVRFCSGLTDNSAKTISRLRSLKILHMAGCSQLTPQCVAKLSSLPLVEFAPPGCVLTDETIDVLVKFKQLRRLVITGYGNESGALTDKGILVLLKMKKIQGLIVEHCPEVSAETLAELAKSINSHRGMWQHEFKVFSGRDKRFHVSGFRYYDSRT